MRWLLNLSHLVNLLNRAELDGDEYLDMLLMMAREALERAHRYINEEQI